MKKTFILLVTIFFICTLMLSAYSKPDTTWTRLFGGSQYEFGRCIEQTYDGGYILVGDTYSYGAGDKDIYLIKIKPDGDTLWTKTYGGTGEEDGFSVQQTSDSGYIILGATSSYGIGGFSFWLVKTKPNGDTLWTKVFGGSEWDWGYSVRQTSDKGYILTGYTESYGPSPYISNLWLIKTDSLGNTDWSKVYGGDNTDYGCLVRETSDGGYIIIGDTYSFGAAKRNIYLLKTNSIGDTSWTRTFGGDSSDAGKSVQQTYDGGYILTGYTESYGAGDKDFWLIKTDSNGIMEWDKTFGGSYEERGESVCQTNDSGYIITGNTESYGNGNSDVYIVRTDIDGDTIWTSTYGWSNQDWGRCIEQTDDGGYIIAGDTYTSLSTGEYDMYVIKLDSETGIKCKSIERTNMINIKNYPNPFVSSTNIYLIIEQEQIINLSVYDIKGQRIKNIINRSLPIGNYNFKWNGRNSSGNRMKPGVYFYKAIIGNKSFSGKIILIK